MAKPADNYIISRDTSEADRLEVQHEYMMSCQGYYLHPEISLPDQGARIADVCTGSAVFLRKVAPCLTNVEFHGFDISGTMFPDRSKLPTNVQLHIADIKRPFEDRWLQYFDVVHLRFIEAAMVIEDWAIVLKNLVTLLKPGGWIQWVEDDRAHSVRHPARPVAPQNAAKESLLALARGEKVQYSPPRFTTIGRFSRLIMPNDRADAMTYGYMNLDALMKDPEVGNLDRVGCDVYVIDRQDDGGKLRRDWVVMGHAAVLSMLKSREQVGDQLIQLTDTVRDELTQGFLEDMDKGGHFITKASVFTGRKKD